MGRWAPVRPSPISSLSPPPGHAFATSRAIAHTLPSLRVPKPRVMAIALGEARVPVRCSGSWSCLPSGGNRWGREPPFGRRPIGYPPPLGRSFCPAACRPLGQIGGPLSMSRAGCCIICFRSGVFLFGCRGSRARFLPFPHTPPDYCKSVQCRNAGSAPGSILS